MIGRSGVAQRFKSILMAGFAVGCGCAAGQSMEPRSYTNAPVGMNFAIFGLGYSTGGVAFDPGLPVKNPDLTVWSSFAGYTRVFDLGGQTGRVSMVLPYAWMSGTAEYMGHTREREQQGIADPIFRISYNLMGAPALTLPEFAKNETDLIVGTTLEVTAPLGTYDSNAAVNLGANRWTIKPEIGLSKALGPFSLELSTAVTFYTANNEFFGGAERTQDPLYSLQMHGVYNFGPAVWAALSATYFAGGQSYVNGVAGDDKQENWRLGATVSAAVSRYHSVKLSASDGMYARTGNNLRLVSIAWQTRWGGGL